MPAAPSRRQSNSVAVEDVIITGELDRRPSRAPDYEGESLAMRTLAEAMATEPDQVLQLLTEAAMALTGSDSAGISLVQPDGEQGSFRWVARAGAVARDLDSSLPWAASACAEVAARNSVLLLREPGRAFPACSEAGTEVHEALLAPFHVDGKAAETVWAIKHRPDGHFEREDARLLQSLARFASAAHGMVRALRGSQAARERSEAELAARLADADLLQSLSTGLIPEQDPNALHEQSLTAAMALMRADAASLQILLPEADQLVLLVSRNLHPQSVAHWRVVDASNASPCGQALRTYARVVIEDAETDPSLVGTQDLEEFRRSGIRAAQSTPLVARSGRPIGLISTHWRGPRRLDAADIRLLDVLARQLADLFERTAAEAALRESETKYRALFETMEQGFCVVERIKAAPGEPSDYRYLAANPAFARHTGLRDVVGKTIRQLVPSAETSIMERYDRVARTGEPDRFEAYVSALDLWMEAEVFPAERPGRIAVLFSNVSDRKRAEIALRASEERQAFLLQLSDALRPLGDPAAIQEAAARIMGEHLSADRAYYVALDEVRQVATVEREYRRGEAPSLVGEHAFAAYGATLERLRAGGAVAFEDVDTDPKVHPADLPAYRALGLRAFLNTPLIKDGELVCAMCVVSAEPRRWTAEEIMLVEEVADRTWAAVERARAEAALRASEERFRMLAEAVEDVFYVTDLERGGLDYVSPAYERVWGRPASELLADLSGFVASLHPDDRAAFEAGKAAQLRGEPVVAEYRVVRPDGTVRWIFDRSFPIGDARRRRAAGVASDVTGRKQAEAARRESEERLRQFGEASSAVLWVRDAETLRWEYLSPAFEAIYGLGRDVALAGDTMRNWVDLIVPEDRERAVACIKRVGAGERITFEYRIHRPADGQVRWLRDTDFPMRDEQGRVVRIGGVGHDVTALKAVEAAVAASEARLRTLMEGIPQLVWRSDGKGQWSWSSPQWTEFTGQAQQESHGLGWLDAVHPDDREAAMQAWQQAPANGRLEVEYRVRRASDGAWLWHNTRSVPVRDAAGGRIVEWLGTSTDIAEQVRAREVLARSRVQLEALVEARTAELMAAEASLRQAQKMEAVGQLTGGIAHDFNNMLQGVAGALELTRRRAEQGRLAEVGRYVESARETVRRAAALTHRLLAFARQQTLAPVMVNLNEMVTGMAEMIRRTVGPAIQVEVRLSDGHRPVLCDESQLENALLNLCVNARDAMPDGGWLTIATEEVLLSAADLAGEEGAAPGMYAAIAVTDSGTGMDEATRSRVFEPFFTTKPLGQGTGLGLSQVYGFVRQSGGVVRLDSAPGRGTTVRICLRYAVEEVQDGAGVARVVLLVEDEEDLRAMAAEWLREAGLRVLEAPDGAAALRLLQGAGRVDALVTDVGLRGGMNGRQVADAARAQWPGLPVLFMTGYAGDALAGQLAPGTEVLAKPFELDQLAARVRAMLEAAARRPAP